VAGEEGRKKKNTEVKGHCLKGKKGPGTEPWTGTTGDHKKFRIGKILKIKGGTSTREKSLKAGQLRGKILYTVKYQGKRCRKDQLEKKEIPPKGCFVLCNLEETDIFGVKITKGKR